MDHDPILESALEEALGGKTPPDLIAQTLALAGTQAASAPSGQPSASARPVWRAWGPGLAAAAAVVIAVGVAALMSIPTLSREPQSEVATRSPDRAASGGTDQARRTHPLANAPAIETVTMDRNRIPGPPPPNPPIPPAEGEDFPPVDTVDGMKFNGSGSNPMINPEDDRLSTFALEHDTGSYTVTRGYLTGGNLPPKEAVRVEEFVNYFDYDYVKPTLDPFEITIDAAPSRYGQDLKNAYLLRVGVQAREIPAANRKPAVLTFVVDVSGSMDGEHRLGLVKRALEMLVNELREGDRVGIAIFGNHGEEYMAHRDAYAKDEIIAAIRKLETKGSTNAEEGLVVGYRMASAAFREGCTNRVILCSDGVANVGRTQVQGLLDRIVENRRNGITLSTVGFGMGNYDDNLMEQLGDKGDGHYAYVDSIDEAKRIFVDNLTGALEVVGRDVKIQIEFNPDVVKSYRLLGYVNRDVKDEDFRNDNVDGGEISAGHAATALYEIKLYDNASGEIGNATLRYKTDEREDFREISKPVHVRDIASGWEAASDSLRLAGNVAEFAEILAEGFYAKAGSLDAVLADLESLRSRDPKVQELIELVKKVTELKE